MRHKLSIQTTVEIFLLKIEGRFSLKKYNVSVSSGIESQKLTKTLEIALASSG